ncbi:MAG: PIG-L family deacetylase [Candidatus Latescibacteria bacterium]|nr:PIG-L family deacetylase [Candidatus Latescibacterota bacterium]
MRVLAISVHPDDETLGCGGTLLRHHAGGDSLFWLIVTQAYEPMWSADVIARKSAEVERVASAYAFEWVMRLGMPTARLDTVPQNDLIAPLRDAISEVRPEVVYVVHGGDVHTDHGVVFTATMSVLKPFYMARLGVHRILCYETLSSTDAAPILPGRQFMPVVYRDISSFIDRKIEIMSFYETEYQADPMPRGPASIRALARHRGATLGVDYAEAFMLIRDVE